MESHLFLIIDSRGVDAVLSLGAEGVYLGTRFIASTECPASFNCKQAIINANENSTIVIEDTFGMLVRALAKQEPQSTQEPKSPNAEDVPISALVVNTGGIREGMIEGDIKNGTVSISMSSAMIKDIKPAKEIVLDLVEGK